jgi:REP element-mobilizing transposase RayT
MTRPLRIDEPGGWHHVMNRGVDRAVIYVHDRDRLTFEKLMGQLAEELGIEIHAYCLMGNHYHLLLHCPHGGLSTFMQQLSSSYTRIVNDRLGRDGPLFRGRFHSVPVLSELQIARAAAYIHRNPIDIVPLAALSAYRWSSYGVYLGGRSAPSWLTRSMVDILLPPDLHRELVASSLDPPGPDNITTDDIDAIVGSRIDPLCPAGKRIRLLLGFDVAGLTAADVALWIGLASAGAARTALARARSAKRDDPALDAITTDLETQLRGAM